VLENLMLGEAEGVRLKASAARERLRDLGGSIGLDVDHGATTGTLALGSSSARDHQALWRGSNVLILDEPTSMLTPQGVAELEQIIARLKGKGLRHLHHAQAARGGLDGRPRLRPQPGAGWCGAIEPDELARRRTKSFRTGSSGSCSAARRSRRGGVAELSEEVEWHVPQRGRR
jgi:simple sugar transport system ATP-binding protein